jgi:SAD/SRA domain
VINRKGHKGGYGNVDKDNGDSLIYCAPGAQDATSKDADDESRGAKLLLKSFETKKPVRVLRGNTKWRGSPYCGYRYDGLYEVVGKGTAKNDKSGMYTWFELERLSGQDNIQKRIPKKAERDAEEKVAAGY